RETLQAYEYLCHIEEAKEWIEAILEIDMGPTTQVETELKNGVYLAKLAKSFEPNIVKKIFEAPNLQYRHTDNIYFFLAFLRKIGLPEVFYFETIDLYESKNMPRVIYCIHALGHYLFDKGQAPALRNLLGKIDFTSDELDEKQRQLDEAGTLLPEFSTV
ncbi:hypothetical protein ROZALSC1DRAFT_7081, partial [Rozella allomycis CSF55]